MEYEFPFRFVGYTLRNLLAAVDFNKHRVQKPATNVLGERRYILFSIIFICVSSIMIKTLYLAINFLCYFLQHEITL
jgi:hypothetical protein